MGTTGAGGMQFALLRDAMSKWNNNEWADLCSGKACPICLDGKPQGIVAELETSYLTSTEASPMKGYCCLILKRHVVELYELAVEEAAALMRDIQQTSRDIQQTSGAVKMNYEIHGNTIPHLHVHLFPRYKGDPFEGGPINPKLPKLIETSPYKGCEFTEFTRKLQTRWLEGQ